MQKKNMLLRYAFAIKIHFFKRYYSSSIKKFLTLLLMKSQN